MTEEPGARGLANPRLARPLLATAAVLAIVGAILAGGGTLGVLQPPLATAAVGLALLGLCVATAAAGTAARGSRRSADAVVVMGFVWFHIAALLVASALGASVLAGGDRLAPALLWGLAAVLAVLLSWTWDQRTETDVDAVLEESRFYP